MVTPSATSTNKATAAAVPNSSFFGVPADGGLGAAGLRGGIAAAGATGATGTTGLGGDIAAAGATGTTGADGGTSLGSDCFNSACVTEGGTATVCASRRGTGGGTRTGGIGEGKGGGGATGAAGGTLTGAIGVDKGGGAGAGLRSAIPRARISA